ncbi:hypothetical protein [Campylobacter gastrosuis]|uniref:Uncharacterized protein n=1 Tax=Campylobacter gastrosuis TaxID=2974576 RepID=A0ABT7HLS1_9BACT|nr:hypothetical protein [Campylobacter gastrosuis]MDL0087911.1 hypothetical protein [Campylobacter gastrosuis]
MADDDKNGALNKAEQERTNSYFAEFGRINNTGMKITQVSIEGVDKYFQKSEYISSLITQPSGFSFTSNTIESELNRTLSADKNQDRLITQNELMSKNEQDEYLKSIVSVAADTRQIRISKLVSSNEDEMKMLQALQAKIKLENVGKEGLNSDEKEALAKFYPDALNQNTNTNSKEITNMQNLLSELKDSFLDSIRVDKVV